MKSPCIDQKSFLASASSFVSVGLNPYGSPVLKLSWFCSCFLQVFDAFENLNLRLSHVNLPHEFHWISCDAARQIFEQHSEELVSSAFRWLRGAVRESMKDLLTLRASASPMFRCIPTKLCLFPRVALSAHALLSQLCSHLAQDLSQLCFAVD